MGLLDSLAGKLTGGASESAGGHDLVASVLELLGNQQGGLAGLASAFQQKGLGNIVSSWIGTGKNLPVSADQIQHVLGAEQVESFAQRAGLSPQAAGSQLAQLLPGVVDKLTPEGEIPAGFDLKSAGVGLLSSWLHGGGLKS